MCTRIAQTIGALDDRLGRRAPSEHDMVKVRTIIKLIERDGWTRVRQKGSHRQFRHPTKPGTVTVPGHPSKDLLPKTKASIMRQAHLK
jgi:predicted RNA binding protein YcfA (HicA-like mRNA interferase family)